MLPNARYLAGATVLTLPQIALLLIAVAQLAVPLIANRAPLPLPTIPVPNQNS